MGRSTFSSDDIVIKSPNDKKLYRLIKLENGLTALLIHDPEIYPQGYSKSLQPSEAEENGAAKGGDGASVTKTAAAAMCVGIGSMSDPVEAQGLAHFLEHMLFMGSTKFPVENEFDSYLSKHGGWSNAYTEAEQTCYYFVVKREFLKGALSRFSQFFVSPLMKSEAMEREVQAIDSEFNRVLQNDFCRLEQLQCYTSLTGHPFNKFSWGNKKSLVNAKEKGINWREQIIKFYKDYYHGGLMKLVVIGGEPLDVLEQWILELYGDVKKDPQVNLEFKAEGPIWKSGKLYRLEAVHDVHIMHLAWTLPCLHLQYLKKPTYYLCHLLQHEGRGSLYFYFKARGWATFISASVVQYSVADVFCMIIYLTDSGLEKIFEIIGLVYQYIKFLQQVLPQEWIFRELQDIGNIYFRFLEEQPPDDYALRLGGNLLRYPEKHAIYGNYLLESWDEKLIEYTLDFLRPDNMRIDVISKSSTLSEDFQCEPWFGSHFIVEDLPLPLIDLWKDPPEIDSSLHLPEKNEFIPSDFSIRSDGLDTANTSSPRCILDGPLVKLWYKLDSTYKLPQANIYFRMVLKGASDNVESTVLAQLYGDLLLDELNEIIYQASVAQLGTSVSVSTNYLELKVSGFNDKIPSLLSKIMIKAKHFSPTHECFKVIKEDMERAYKNANMNPWSHSTYLRDEILYRNFYNVDEELHALNGLTVCDVKTFIPKLWSPHYIEGLCHGNLLEEEAISLLDALKTNFSVQPDPVELKHKNNCICLPPCANLVRDVRVKNASQTNSVIELYFQIEWAVGVESTKLRALVDLFCDIVNEPLYDQLRTKEQLGYVVQCDWNVTLGAFGFYFKVQSSEYNPIYLQRRVENFIDGLEELLLQLDDDSFENYRGGLIAKLLEKDSTLIDESARYWDHIIGKRYTFDKWEKIAGELRSLQKGDVINFYKTYLQQSCPKRRRLTIRVWGCNTDMKEAEEARLESEQVIEDLAAFKSSSQFYDRGSCQTVAPSSISKL